MQEVERVFSDRNLGFSGGFLKPLDGRLHKLDKFQRTLRRPLQRSSSKKVPFQTRVEISFKNSGLEGLYLSPTVFRHTKDLQDLHPLLVESVRSLVSLKPHRPATLQVSSCSNTHFSSTSRLLRNFQNKQFQTGLKAMALRGQAKLLGKLFWLYYVFCSNFFCSSRLKRIAAFENQA